MRLWTVHPRYLDARGLVAAWREALLAQKVLAGATKGYRAHPQLVRFHAQTHPGRALAAFLEGIAQESLIRRYCFDITKISQPMLAGQIEETSGQLLYEWKHLKRKLRKRAPALYRQVRGVTLPEA